MQSLNEEQRYAGTLQLFYNYEHALRNVRGVYYELFSCNSDPNSSELDQNLNAVFILDAMIDRNLKISRYLSRLFHHEREMQAVMRILDALDMSNISKISERVEMFSQKIEAEGFMLTEALADEYQTLNNLIQKYLLALGVLGTLLLMAGICAISSPLGLACFASGAVLLGLYPLIRDRVKYYMGSVPDAFIQNLRQAGRDLKDAAIGDFLAGTRSGVYNPQTMSILPCDYVGKYVYVPRAPVEVTGGNSVTTTKTIVFEKKCKSEILVNSFFNKQGSIADGKVLCDEVCPAYETLYRAC